MKVPRVVEWVFDSLPIIEFPNQQAADCINEHVLFSYQGLDPKCFAMQGMLTFLDYKFQIVKTTPEISKLERLPIFAHEEVWTMQNILDTECLLYEHLLTDLQLAFENEVVRLGLANDIYGSQVVVGWPFNILRRRMVNLEHKNVDVSTNKLDLIYKGLDTDLDIENIRLVDVYILCHVYAITKSLDDRESEIVSRIPEKLRLNANQLINKLNIGL